MIMKKLVFCSVIVCTLGIARGQDLTARADSLKDLGLLVPALEQYGMAFMQDPSPEHAYPLAATSALLWTSVMRDTAFYFLHYALEDDSGLDALYDPSFLSLIGDPRWKGIEDAQIRKYEAANGAIKNEAFARALFRMIIKDQGFMYQGNLERRKYMENGGYFSSPAIFPVLAMEERNHMENEKDLYRLLEVYGWPTASAVTEVAAAGAALIINHSDHETRLRYFPLLEEAFLKGEAQPLRYAKMRDRLLVEGGMEQLYGTQWHFEGSRKVPWPIEDPEHVDRRRADIGLGPLHVYLKERFDIDWQLEQK
jgi:hypothetical protein